MSTGVELSPLVLLAIIGAIEGLRQEQTNQNHQEGLISAEEQARRKRLQINVGALEDHPVVQALASTEVLPVTVLTEDLGEVMTAIKKAGHPVTQSGPSLTAEMAGIGVVRVVEREGRWTALLPKAAGPEALKGLMAQINKAAGKTLMAGPQTGALHERHFPTCFRDAHLLEQTVRALGGTMRELRDGLLEAKIDDIPLLFETAGDGSMTLVVQGPEELVGALGRLQVLDGDYRRQTQQHTRQTLLNNLEQHGAVLTQEEELEDGTILLTLELPDA